MNPTPTQTAPRPHADAAQIPADPLRAFIGTCLRSKQTPLEISDAVKATFGIEIDDGQLIPGWKGEITIPTQTEHGPGADEITLPTQTERRQYADETALPTQTERRQDADEIGLPTQTEHRPDQESVQFPADEAQEPLFTRMPDIETSAQTPFSITPDPSPVSGGWDADDAPATQTEPGQDPDTMQTPADAVDAPGVTRAAPEAAIQALAAPAKARLGMAPDPAEKADSVRAADAATQTGRGRDQKTRSILTDAVKAFIVRGLAHYETPSRVAASVQARFGVAIDRRQVYAYDPAGSRPPAQRWIDLHAATRAQFLDAAAEIGVAQARGRALGDDSPVRSG